MMAMDQVTLKDDQGLLPLWVKPRGGGAMRSPEREVFGVAVSIAHLHGTGEAGDELGVVVRHVDVPGATKPGVSWWTADKAEELGQILRGAAAMVRRINAVHARQPETPRELAEKHGVRLASDDERGFPS